MTTSLRGKPTADDGFGASASDNLFVIIPTTVLLLLKFTLGGGKEIVAYRKRYRCFPLRIPWGPRTRLVGAYEELRLDVAPPP